MPTPTNRNVRMTDVASAAGVSVQTVSNVLAGRGRFTEDTMQRVLKAAAQLGFTKNRSAFRLRTNRSGQIGLHIPREQLGIRDYASMAFMAEVVDAAERLQHQVVMITHPLDSSRLAATDVDGYILSNVDLRYDRRPKDLEAAGVPFAVFGRLDDSLPGVWTDIHNDLAMHQVVDHLVARGCRTFSYLGYQASQYWHSERRDGTRSRLAYHGFTLSETEIPLIGGPELLDYQIQTLLGPHRPDAIICSSDSLAMIVHVRATAAGLRPGSDFALTGFDALPLAIDLNPTLTSVRLPVPEAAENVVRVLLRQIEDPSTQLEPVFLPTDLAVGGSA